MTFGTLTAVDPNEDDTHSFALVEGEDSDGNSSFLIDGNSLQAAGGFDYDIQNSYTIRVRTTDIDGLFLEKVFRIDVEKTPFRRWAEALPDGEQGEEDDPGNHGITNLLRYAFGMNAVQPERDKLPRVGQETA